MSRTWPPRPRVTLGRLMAAIAVLAVVFAVLRLPLGFLMVPGACVAVGAAVGCRRDPDGLGRFAAVVAGAVVMLTIAVGFLVLQLFSPHHNSGLDQAVSFLVMSVPFGLVFGTVASAPVWLIMDIRRAWRRREEARARTPVDHGETGYGDRSGPP